MNRWALSTRAIRLVAERRIEAAVGDGWLQNLPGAGKPIPDLDEPYDPEWWVRGWIRRQKLGRSG